MIVHNDYEDVFEGTHKSNKKLIKVALLAAGLDSPVEGAMVWHKVNYLRRDYDFDSPKISGSIEMRVCMCSDIL